MTAKAKIQEDGFLKKKINTKCVNSSQPKWPMVKLGEVCKIQRGGSPRPIQKYLTDDKRGISWIRIGDVRENNKYITRTKQRIKKQGLVKTRLVKRGDLILSNSMSFGRPYITKIEGAIHDGWLLIRINNNNILTPYFLYEILSSAPTRQQYEKFVAGGVVKNLSSALVKMTIIPLPLLEEQKRIVAVLSTWDQAIEKLEELIVAKQKQFRWLLKTLISDQKNNLAWKKKKLNEMSKFYKGKNLSKKDISKSGLYRCIHYGELFTNYDENIENVSCFTNNRKNMFLSSKNDVLMPTSDVTPTGLATASCINEDDVVLGGDILVIRPDKNILDGRFLAYFIKSNRNEVMRLVSGTTVYHIYGSDMGSFQIMFPHIKEQQKIVSILLKVRDEIEVLKKLLVKYQEQKKGLMQQLLTGKTRVPPIISIKEEGRDKHV